MSNRQLHLDLHPIAKQGKSIDAALQSVMTQAVDKKVAKVEIICGKGAGQLKKRVLKFLQQPSVKVLYDRVEKDARNHGRIFVWF